MQKIHIYIHDGGGAIFREHGNRTLAPCAVPSIYMIYVYAISRVCRSFCECPRARTRMTKGTRTGAHARATSAVTKVTRSSRRKLPSLPLPSSTPTLATLFPERRICIHTTSHTTRFNISDHRWKLSPETQADARGTIGLASAAMFAIALLFRCFTP